MKLELWNRIWLAAQTPVQSKNSWRHATARRQVKFWPLAALLCLACGLSAVRAATLVHEFFLPMPEAQIYQTFSALETNLSTTLDSTYSIVVTGNHFVLDAVAGVIALAPAPVLRYVRQELRLSRSLPADT